MYSHAAVREQLPNLSTLLAVKQVGLSTCHGTFTRHQSLHSPKSQQQSIHSELTMYLLPGKVTAISKTSVSKRAENDDNLAALYNHVKWNHSHLIDPELVKESGSFTTLTVRINDRDDVANDASDRILRDWAKHMRDGQEQKSLNSHSVRGNLCSFTFIDSPPARLDVVTYWTDIGLLHDGQQ